MARGFSGAMLRSFGARDHIATVIETVRIAPHFVRVRMTSPTLFEDVDAEPAAWLRFWFPDPDGSKTEFQRAYTISEADVPAGRFAVDIVLHDPAGPASLWARTVQPGATIAVMALMGSSRFDMPDEQPAGYLLIGDSASIPGMNGIIGVVPDDVPIEMYLEQHDDNDTLIPVAQHPRLRLHWVARRGEKSLAAAIESRDWSNWYAWATPEATTLKRVRTRLRDEFGFPKSVVHAQAYWSAGRAMGTRRGDEPDAPDHVAPSMSAEDVAARPDSTQQVSAAGARGNWRAQGAGRVLAPLRSALVASGVLQAVITLVQLAPFVLLVELARLLVSGAPASRLWDIGIAAVSLVGLGALLGAALTLWLHVVDARFARDLRERLLHKLSRLPLGWFTARGSGSIKQLLQDDTLSLHYLVTHAVPDAVAAAVAPVAVLVYLFAVDWRVALVLFVPVLIYLVLTSSLTIQSGPRIPQSQRWAETMSGEAGAYL
ncbi:MAG TPA: SIP domain-containing protein, partial [Mycobacterium sp.]|nr:SIP domain-containing protein [Mycobacterium sp.]